MRINLYVCVYLMKKTLQMRRIYYLLLAGTFLFGMASCNENKEKETEATTENITTTEEATPATTSNTETEVALNPPHGQPGHICEIPVGQPLPSGSGAATPSNVQLKTPLMKENQKLNPPHGQPGHVCEIPVGQPLP